MADLSITCRDCGLQFQHTRSAGQRGRNPLSCNSCRVKTAYKGNALKSYRRHSSKACASALIRQRQSRIDRKCEGCGEAGQTSVRCFCPPCFEKSANILRQLRKRRAKGRVHLAPRLSVAEFRNVCCKECDAPFSASALGNGRYMIFCSRKCQKANSDRKRTKARRALTRGAMAAVRIDPTEVFVRDAWRCRMCGVGTPKRLRGKNEARSPELDHIVPLALGGPHTWDNLQCLCRQCNLRKGATAFGQLMLFPALFA